MKIAILTTALSVNYGAALQAYALVESVRKMGYSVNNINYNDPNRIAQSMSTREKITHAIWRALVYLLSNNRKERNFTIFQRNNLLLTRQRMTSSSELKNTTTEYDLFIAGSDQIWNPSFFINDLSYYFDFLPENTRRISYASSFGKADFGSEKYRDRCASLLSRFQHISVREQSGVRIVKELCGKDATWVLDPTLLLDEQEWMSLAEIREKSEDIILCYTMPGDKMVTDSIETIARNLSKVSGLPIVRLGNKEYDVFRYGKKSCDITAGPIEFIRYFLKAKYVVTNSFHGTAFSLNFGKDFIIPINDSIDNSSALHERLLSILKLLGAENAIIKTSEISDSIDFGSHLINHYEIKDRLINERKKSLDYLRAAIGDSQ